MNLRVLLLANLCGIVTLTHAISPAHCSELMEFFSNFLEKADAGRQLLQGISPRDPTCKHAYKLLSCSQYDPIMKVLKPETIIKATNKMNFALAKVFCIMSKA